MTATVEEERVPMTSARFSLARFESCMVSSKTSYKQLEDITGYNIKKMASEKNIARDILNYCCVIMNCDPNYILMLNNDPKVGSFNKTPYVKEKEKEVKVIMNSIIKERVVQLIDEQQLTDSVFAIMVGLPSYSVDMIITKKNMIEDNQQRIAWVLATSVDYITGASNDRYGNPTSSKIPITCNFQVNGKKIDKVLLLKKRCGLSMPLIDWLCSGNRMIPKSLATKIAKATQKRNYWEFKGSGKIPKEDEPLDNKPYEVVINKHSYFDIIKEKAIEAFNHHSDEVKPILHKYLMDYFYKITDLFNEVNAFMQLKENISSIVQTRVINILIAGYGLVVFHFETGDDAYAFKIIDMDLFRKHFAKENDVRKFIGIYSSSTPKFFREKRMEEMKKTKKTAEVENPKAEEEVKAVEFDQARFTEAVRKEVDKRLREEKEQRKPITVNDIMNYCNVLNDNDLDVIVRYIECLKQLRRVYNEGAK